MGVLSTKQAADELFEKWKESYDIFAPRLMEGEGCFSDTDVIRYGKISSLDEIVWDRKSDYSFKEVLIPINETLFYFTEDETTVPKEPEKDKIIFLRSCDIHALKRLDQIYLNNQFGDFYYERRRNKIKLALMECEESCKSGFCVSMDTNKTSEYDIFVKIGEDGVYFDVKDEKIPMPKGKQEKKEPAYVTENHETVALPKQLSNDSFSDELWEEYGDRCIQCGRCNFVCPTCTCFSMQDIFYKDNPKVGERRRVWSSCQVDGYTDLAGGHSFRSRKSERMRFKVMHKIYDFKKKFGYTMCVGCGRCEEICPEYISYTRLINRLAEKEQKV